MMRGLRAYLFGAAAIGALATLAGCGHFLLAEREAWRHEAEAGCLSSGAVREGPGKVRISPIDGPGVCGIDFPLKVASLGSDAPLSFGEELRPPGAVPNAGNVPSRWPLEPRPPAGVTRDDLPPPAPRYGEPLTLDPARSGSGASEPYDFRRPYATQRPIALGRAREAEPRGWGQPPGPIAVNPPATLACPLVSVLDRWIDEAVQPAALRWLGAPVIEIKQISAYSCRGMNGDPNATISEHAFGNALDIAAFRLADGRKITVQDGWNGRPEERGFLHDVQLSACENFTTVLAPGYNIFHYNHIHVDLMRRASGRHPCRPDAIPGEVAAARAREMYVNRRGPAYTGSIPTKAMQPVAVPGEDGLGDDDDVVTGFIAKARRASGAVDHDYDLTDGTQAQASALPRAVHKPAASIH